MRERGQRRGGSLRGGRRRRRGRRRQVDDEERDDEDVGHRPLGDELDELGEAHPRRGIARKHGQRDQRRLGERHDHAEEQDQRGRHRAADVVELPHRSDDAAGLLVDLDVLDALLQGGVSCGDSLSMIILRRSPPSACIMLTIDGLISDLSVFIVSSFRPFSSMRAQHRRPLLREHAANRQHRREDAGGEKRERNHEQDEVVVREDLGTAIL